MLFRSVAAWVVRSLGTYSNLCLIPLKVTKSSVSGGTILKIQADVGLVNRWVFGGFVALRLGHCAFLFWRLLLVCTEPGRYFRVEEFPMLISLVVTLVSQIGFSYSTFGSNAQTTALVLTEILRVDKDNKPHPHLQHDSGPSQLSTLIRNALAAASPLIGPLTVSLLMMIFILNPAQVYVIYSGLPEPYQSPLSMVCSLGLDAALLLLSFTTLFLVALIPLEVPDIVLSKVEGTLRRLEQPGFNLILSTKKTLKEVQVLVLLTNLTCRHVILFSKVIVMTVATLLPFFAMKYYHTFPLMSSAYLVMGLTALFGFIIIYDKAFRLPAAVEELKERSLVRLQQERGISIPEALARCFQRELAALPKLCFKVGNFRTLERESTPLLLDFVVSNIVNLLLSFK